MNILLTGANGYIGQRLIPVLLAQNHHLYCCVRNKIRFQENNSHPQIDVIEIDFLQATSQVSFPVQIDAAYYLIHSMTHQGDFEAQEAKAARHFVDLLQPTQCQQIIYLSGIVNEIHLSRHLSSRFKVEEILNSSAIPVTTLRAGIIIGSGSASFEIMRDLVEKLPVMITPKWLNTLCQPIAIRNVIQFLTGVLLQPFTYQHHFDIGGTEVLSYKQMLLQFAEVRQLKRWIWTIPVMTPRLSSYWLYFVTSTSYPLAVQLVHSMKVHVVCTPNHLAARLHIELLPYKLAVQLAFEKIEQQMVISSWKDAFSSSGASQNMMQHAEVPRFGCFTDIKWRKIDTEIGQVVENVWRIGGNTGWYYANTLWQIRGFLDKLAGGVGLRRGRTNPHEIQAGDALDFWRVLVADKEAKRLLLFAEMKLPGEAWLEFKFIQRHHEWHLRQTATFRPRGLWGRLYWFGVLPFHFFIFNGMIRNLVKTQ